MAMVPTGYEYDVFLSYSHSQHWPKWVEGHFLPVIRHWISAELGRDVTIFYDRDGVGAGEEWPDRLERALAASRTMITLWSRNYFRSEWCTRELSAHLKRAHYLGRRGLSGNLVFPVAIHDSAAKDLPELVRTMHVKKVQNYADPFAHKDGPLVSELSRELRTFSEKAAHEIDTLPAETFAWPLRDYSDYHHRLRLPPQDPSSPPSLG